MLQFQSAFSPVVLASELFLGRLLCTTCAFLLKAPQGRRKNFEFVLRQVGQSFPNKHTRVVFVFVLGTNLQYASQPLESASLHLLIYNIVHAYPVKSKYKEQQNIQQPA